MDSLASMPLPSRAVIRTWQVIIFDILRSLVTVSDLWDVSAYIKSTVLSMQEIQNSKKLTDGPQGTLASKTAKPVHLLEKGLNKLRINLAEVNLTHKIESEVCLTLPLESQHFKYPSYTVLEYARTIHYLRTASPSKIFQKCHQCLQRKCLKQIKR